MRVLMLLTDAFGAHGGIAKFNRDFLSALDSAPEVSDVIALPRLMPDEPGPFPAKLRYRTEGLGGKFAYLRAVLRVARQLSHEEPPAILFCGHINLLPAAFFARWCLRRRRQPFPLRTRSGVVGEASNTCSRPSTLNAQPPIVLIIHGIDAWQPTRSALTNWLASRVDSVISVSEFTRKRFWDWARPQTAKSSILPNCVDLERFTPGPKNVELLKRYELQGKTVLLTVARMSAAERYKGIEEVLEVLPSLSKSIPNLAYLIVGDGDDRRRLEEKARNLHLSVYSSSISDGSKEKERCVGATASESSISNLPPSPQGAPSVIFTGHITETEKVDHYRLADVYVMPGRGEGFGIVYLEALGCGIPIVASQLDASGEIVAKLGTGFVANSNQPGNLLKTLALAASDGRGGRPCSLDSYSVDSFKGEVSTLLRCF